MIHLAAHLPRSSLTLPWFRALFFMVFLFSFEEYHPKAGTKTLSSFVSFVLHLAEISNLWNSSSPFLTQQTRMRPSLHLWHHPGSCMAFQIHSGSLGRLCYITTVKVLFSSFWSAQTRFLQRHCYILYDPHGGKKSFSQGSHNISNNNFFFNYCKIFYRNDQLMADPKGRNLVLIFVIW